MSTFFTNLISRSLAPDLQVAPRPVSRFEPPGMDDAFGFAPPGELEHARDEAPPDAHAAPAPPANPRREAAAPATPPAMPAPPVETLHHESHARTAAPVMPARSEPPAAPSITPAPPALRMSSRAPAAIPRTAHDQPQPSAPAVLLQAPPAPSARHEHAEPAARQIVEREIVERITTRERLQPIVEQHAIEQHIMAAAPPHEAVPPPEQARIAHAAPQHARERIVPHHERQHAQQPTIIPRPHAEPRAAIAIQPRIEPPVAHGPPAAQRAEPAPIIQVTIGRIDVRATPPAAQPPRQRAQPAVMSLDEYLRQRSRGGGR